jgi:hypothetical protein
LANSAKITVERAALRNNAATLSGADEFPSATDSFRIGIQNRANLIPEMRLTEHDTWTRASGDAVDGRWAASDSFERAEGKYGERKDKKVSELSSITQPILKLYAQLGGFIKR